MDEMQAPLAGDPAPPDFDAASGAVKGPAICLIVVAGLGLLISGLLTMGVAVAPNEAPPPEMNEAEQTGFVIGQTASKISAPLSVGLSILVIYGSIMMLQLKSRGLAMTACILALIPCIWNFCLFGIPFGIWGLITLGKPEIKQAFEAKSKAEGNI